jgi:hypothetical protein
VNEQTLRDAQRAWLAAWEAKNVAAYLAAYAPDFVPADGSSREAWAAARQRAVSGAQAIRIVTSNEAFTFPGASQSQATSRFRQSYRSSNYADVVEKTIEWAHVGGRWLIRREIARPLGTTN